MSNTVLKSRILPLASALAFAVAPTLSAEAAWKASDPSLPAVPYGKIVAVPDAHNRPDPSKTYKAVFDVTTKSQAADKPNGGLVHVARAVNVFASAGVPLDHLKFVAVVHGPATSTILDEEHYQKQFETKNPNIAVIKALKDVGVEVHVCGQALADSGYKSDWVDKDVSVDLSALSSVIVYGNEGYAYMAQ